MFRKAKDWIVTGGKIETILGPNTSFNGHLKTDGNVRIEGLFEGVIETVGNVIIGEGAKVNADIIAHSVQVWGLVAGSISATERLEILPTGRVFADVAVRSLLIDDGGLFRGECTIHGASGDIPLEESAELPIKPAESVEEDPSDLPSP